MARLERQRAGQTKVLVSDLLALLKLIPVLLALIKSIRKYIETEQLNSSIKTHVQGVQQAFETKDASKLNALFNKPSA